MTAVGVAVLLGLVLVLLIRLKAVRASAAVFVSGSVWSSASPRSAGR